MVELLLMLTFNSLFVLGMYLAMQFEGSDDFDANPEQWRLMRGKPEGDDKQILWWVRWYGSYLPWWIQKFLYKCPTCMASLWSIPVFGYFGTDCYVWLLYVPALAALDTILAKKFKL